MCYASVIHSESRMLDCLSSAVVRPVCLVSLEVTQQPTELCPGLLCFSIDFVLA